MAANIPCEWPVPDANPGETRREYRARRRRERREEREQQRADEEQIWELEQYAHGGA